jgi:predicted DNA-binding transcriptional regulator AlpA
MKQKAFQFTLVLNNVHENTPDLEDSLYEAGCDDALVNFRNGTVYLDFDRKASSLEEAVISAIKDIQSSSVEANVASVAPENLVTETEVAKRLKISRQTVSLWIKGERRKSFPHPVMRLAEKSPLWNWSEIVNWLYENKIVDDKELVENALFLANINAALEERDMRTRELRHNLLERISLRDGHRNYGQ